MKNQKVLITGGLGFIGKSLAAYLVSKNVQVTIFDSNEYQNAEEASNKYTLILGSVLDTTIWDNLDYFDYVVHLAGPSSIIQFNADLSSSTKVTINGFINCLNWCSKSKPKLLVYPSSGNIFSEFHIPCSEETIPKPSNTYGMIKYSLEFIAEAYSKLVPTTCLRIFTGYGYEERHKKDTASVVTHFIRKMVLGQSPLIYGNGSQTRDFVYIDDILEAIYHSLQSGFIGKLNVGTGEDTSYNQIVSIINTNLGTSIAPKYVKKPMSYLERTLCSKYNINKVLKRKPISINEGIKLYLNML